MSPVRRRPARNLISSPVDQTGTTGANAVGNSSPDDGKSSKNARANAAQYPYPSPYPPVNGGQDTPSKTPLRNQVNSNLVDTNRGNGVPETVVQASQPTSESTAVSTLTVSTTVTTSVPSVSPSSTSASSISSRSTTAGSTLIVPPPNFSTRQTAMASSLSPTFPETESSPTSDSQSSSEDSNSATPSTIQLSPTVIGIFIAIGGVIFLVAFICILRCILRQWRHKRRRLKEATFDFSRSNEKNSWEVGDGEKSAGIGAGSPSTIFGGNERLTPQPSWMTLNETDRVGGTASPYPLGLLPPPTNVQRAPSLRAHTGLGISHQAFHTGYSNHNHPTMARHIDPRDPSFEPPTITITNSSPRQSAPWVAKHSRDRPGPGATKASTSGSDISPANSYNRVSVYTDPVRGAQLVKPPRLTLVNDDPSLSESDGGPRQSGWSSWDDGVGLELGVTIDRKHLPPRSRSRIPVTKSRKGVSPLRITLAPVQEVSDTSDAEALKTSPSRSAIPTVKLHPGQLRGGSSSPSSLKRSPRSTKSASPRALKQPQAQTLYDLPQFDALSPSVNSSIRVASPNSTPNSPTRQQRELDRGTSSSKRRSKRSCRRTSSSKQPPISAPPRPSSAVSEALSDMYAYVHAYALSSTESEEIQVRRRSKPSGKPKSPKSPRLKEGDRLAPYGSPQAVGSSPAVSDTVGELMMKAYGEEGSIPSPSVSQLSERAKGRIGKGSGVGRKENVMKESNRVNVPQASHSVGLGLTIQKQRLQPLLQQQQQSRIPQSTRQRHNDASVTNPPSFSPQSEYSEHQTVHPSTRRYPDSSRFPPQYQQRGVPSLPPPGMPNLHQLKLMRDMPDYRSPTYSVYGMYRDENRASPLQNSPVQYRYASAAGAGKTRTVNGNGTGNGARVAWRADVI